MRRIVLAEWLCGVLGLTIGLSGLLAQLEAMANLGVLLCLSVPALPVAAARTTRDRQDGVEALVAMLAVAFGGYLLGEAAGWPLAMPSAVLAGCALHMGFTGIAGARRRDAACGTGLPIVL